MTADLSALIARLEAAEAGGRELDEAISDTLCDHKFRTCIAGLSDEDGGMWMYEFGGHAASSALRVTTSLDAALALTERVLTKRWGVSLFDGDPCHGSARYCSSVVWSNDNPPKGTRYDGAASTLPLALCIAILRAKAQEG